MNEVVSLSITHFRYAIGGEHYYGRLEVRTKETQERRPDGSVRTFLLMGAGTIRHPNDGHELMRAIDAKEALYLNKKDGEGIITPSSRLTRGSLVNRFNDRESVIAAAIEVFPTLFDETDILVHSPKVNEDDYVFLAGPDVARSALEGLDYDRSERWLRDNGYLVNPLKE